SSPSYHHHLPLTPKVPCVSRLPPSPFPQTRTYRITDLTVDPFYPMATNDWDQIVRDIKQKFLEQDRQPPPKPATPPRPAPPLTQPAASARPPPNRPAPPPARPVTRAPTPTTHFEATTNRFAKLFPILPSFADNLSVSDDASDAESYDEGVEARLLAEAEELIHYNDELQEFATAQFATHPNPCFKHPLQYALHLMKLGLATLSSPPSEPIAKLRECGVQATPTPAPPHAECGVQTTPMPALIPSPLPPVWKPRPASRTPRPTKTPLGRSISPSTLVTFDKVLAQLSALRKEVSPPPSPPPTPRAVSPVPRTENPHHSSITVAVPYGTTSLAVDHPIYAWSFKIAASPPPAQVQRGRSPRRRPLAEFGTSVSAPHESGYQGPPRSSRVSFGSIS
ncbi:hypothetical protein LXA43DRAFT_1154672, partial [Ganoderma leucocontextum]